MKNSIAIAFGIMGVALASVAPTPTPPTPLGKDSWALLVAGSKGYVNYRHQADISHSYHVMIAEGIPQERIIVMMYDDIAYNDKNPNKGVIINRPNGTNVYAGVKIDYKGDDVNPDNFLAVLSGNKAAVQGGTGRVIESNSETNVFVYFADHGGVGLLCFPNADLTADDLERTLRTMHKNKQYKKLIMYIEACESGSMFDNILEENINVFVMTAAARDESSYAWYCDKSWNCLGDEFSIRWMEHMDKEKKGTVEQFFHQFDKVRSAVTKSHVNIYGDYSIGSNALTPNKDGYTAPILLSGDEVIAVNSRDVPLYYYRNKLSQSNDVNAQRVAQRELDELIRGRKNADSLFEDLVDVATVGQPHLRKTIRSEKLLLNKSVFPCYKQLLQKFRTHCFGHEHEYFIQHFYKLANICIAGLDTSELLREMGSICAPYKATIKTSVV